MRFYPFASPPEFFLNSSFFLIHRERPDTIRSIVANLVGDDDSGDSLVDENEPIQPLQQPELEDYTDPNWEPDPIDAGPGQDFSFFFFFFRRVRKRSLMDLIILLVPCISIEFRTNKPSDVISTLVSIYDSKDLFVKELQVLLAQRLLAITKDSSDRVEREVQFGLSFILSL